MKIQFLYSQTQEIQRLIDLRLEYPWFAENNFPAIFPKFYNSLCSEKRAIFKKNLRSQLASIYDRKLYAIKKDSVRKQWSKIEGEFFAILEQWTKNQKNYICHISLYGPQGQFSYPNTITVRAHTKRDVSEINETIAHELIHLLIYKQTRKLKLNYEQTEIIVDLFFKKTKLKEIFPYYKMQNIPTHIKNPLQLFQSVIRSL